MAPIFFISVLAVLESAFIINSQLSLDNATRDGVREGALCGSTIGPWTDPNGVQYVGGPQATPCQDAIDATVRADMKIFHDASKTVLSIPPAVAPQPPYTTDCPAPVAGAYSAPQGCVIQVNATFTYRFFLNFLIGPDAPSIDLHSSATAVSQ